MPGKKPSIIVTGANGQVGRCLQKASSGYPAFDFHFLGREHLPVDNHELTRNVISAIQPFAVINTAAYTAVDRAETEPDTANSINGYAVGNLAKHCLSIGARFLHISSDYVFDGLASGPYKETDDTNPVNAYGASKLLGEQLALKENPAAVIIRTSWVYSPYGHNFVKTMIRLMSERENINVVNDQYGSPTYAMDLANAITKMIVENNWIPGIFHYCNQGVISWYDLAKQIQEIKRLHCIVNPIPTEKFPTPAKRPQYSGLDCTKINKTYHVVIPDWKTSLADALMEI